MTTRRSNFAALASGVGLIAITSAAPAFAQDQPTESQAAAEDTGALSEIVVTADKRTENLQEVPIAISAVQSEELELRGLSEAKDLSAIAPNVAVSSGTTNATA